MDEFLTSNPDEIVEATSHRVNIERRMLNIESAEGGIARGKMLGMMTTEIELG